MFEKYNEFFLIKNKTKQNKTKHNSIKKGFKSEAVYNEKYLKTKIKSDEGKINTHFHNDKVLKESNWWSNDLVRAWSSSLVTNGAMA